MKKYLAETYVNVMKDLQKDIHQTATEKGWWAEPRDDGTILMLIVTEIAEACEGLRMGNNPDDKIPDYKNCEAELADVIIRILDFADERGHDVIGALMAKMKYNKTRKYRHGKKF